RVARPGWSRHPDSSVRSAGPERRRRRRLRRPQLLCRESRGVCAPRKTRSSRLRSLSSGGLFIRPRLEPRPKSLGGGAARLRQPQKAGQRGGGVLLAPLPCKRKPAKATLAKENHELS